MNLPITQRLLTLVHSLVFFFRSKKGRVNPKTKELNIQCINILALIKHVKLHNQKAKLKAIYFSASLGTLESVLPELEPLWKAEFDGLIQIITRTDVKPFVEANGCIGVPTEDSLETTEMELCYRASAFLRFEITIQLEFL